MNLDKLDVVKQEMARINIDLGVQNEAGQRLIAVSYTHLTLPTKA